MAKDFGFNITATDVYLWKKEIEGKNGTFYKYSTSITGKNIDGEREYMQITVQLPKNCPPIHNKTKVNFEGFPAFDVWKKDGKEVKDFKIVVTNITIADNNDNVSALGFQQAEEDMPF